MIHVITTANRQEYEDVIEQHYKIRHDIFVGERNWEALRKPDGREIDAYDNENTIYFLELDADRNVFGGHRIYPTTVPNMMSEIFPHLAHMRGVPRSPNIWEWSRYFIVPSKRDTDLNIRLMAAVQDYCLMRGIEQISAIMETWWLSRFLSAGFNVVPLGLPYDIEGEPTIAALIDIDQNALDGLIEHLPKRKVIVEQAPHLRSLEKASMLATSTIM